MKSIRVCHIVEGTVDVRTVEGLASDYSLTVVGRNTEAGYTITHPPSETVPTIIGPGGRFTFARFVFSYLLQNKNQFDAVIVQGYGLSALAANLAARRTATPTYMLVLSPVEAYYLCRKTYPSPGKPYSTRELLAFRLVAWINARVGQHYLVMSRHLGDVVRGHGGRKPISIVPIYGVNTHIFAPSSQSKKLIRASLGLPTEGELIFFSSRIAPEKDSQTLLTAFRALRERGRDVWLLNRSGGYKTILEEAERIGIADRVIATDAAHPHQALPLSYQASDLCVQASREEGLGFSPLEALACGVPVVAAAVGGLRETIIDGETGWTYPVGDWESLADQIEAALDDTAEAARRTAAGRALVIAEYDSCVAFNRMMKVLEKP
jgi:glycosyltransferase involved in cell wall biosynthesis